MTSESRRITGSSVIQAMLKRLAEEEAESKQQETQGTVEATKPQKANAARV